MNWKIELVKASHYIERDYKKQLAYYDTLSDCLVPMFNEPLCPRDILQMEEWSQSDDGIIFMDYKTHRIGLLIRN
jgi:hypothetical protein